jgi:hypothetical protein
MIGIVVRFVSTQHLENIRVCSPSVEVVLPEQWVGVRGFRAFGETKSVLLLVLGDQIIVPKHPRPISIRSENVEYAGKRAASRG